MRCRRRCACNRPGDPTVLMALGYALLVWWAGTGLILVLNRLPRRWHPALFAVATVMLVVALAGIGLTSTDQRRSAAFLAFTAAIAVWGWQELGFLLGYLTGPRRLPCPPEARGWQRFQLALQVILWHELVLLALGTALFLLSWGQPNPVAAWTFAVLWSLRLSAKLNLFLGVRNLGEAFLPEHLRYLHSYFRQRDGNPLFLPSVAAAAAVAALLWQQAWTAGSPFEQAGLALTASLLSLAVLEHAFMMLPLASERLWWLRRLQPAPAPSAAAAAHCPPR